MSGPTVCVIGAGFSGTLVAAHLLRADGPRRRILLVERRSVFGPGTAYGTGSSCHLLNVPAAKMSAFPDEPDHFREWLSRRTGRPIEPGRFAERRQYGAYLRELLDDAQESARDRHRLLRIADRAVAIERDGDGFRVRFTDHAPVDVKAVVLAIGHLPPGHPPLSEGSLTAHAWYRPDPWDPRNFDGTPHTAHVVLVGAGLTAIDQLLALREREHTGPVTMLSRTGLLPRPHGPSTQSDACLDVAAPPATALALLRGVRAGIRRAAGSWRSVFDALRPLTANVWANMPLREKLRFLRHARSYWEIHRHRVPADVAARLEAEVAANSLTVLAGRLESASSVDGRAALQFRLRGSNERRRVDADLVVNCTGPECDYRRAQDPLMLSLLDAGLARMDPLRMGIEVAPSGAVQSSTGEESPRLFTVGPLRKGALWETTAVPELRVQARDVALRVARALDV